MDYNDNTSSPSRENMSLPGGPLDLRTQPDIPSTPSAGRPLPMAEVMEEDDIKDTLKANRAGQMSSAGTAPGPPSSATKGETIKAIERDFFLIDNGYDTGRIRSRYIELSASQIKQHIDAIRGDFGLRMGLFQGWSQGSNWIESETKLAWQELVEAIYNQHHDLLYDMLVEAFEGVLQSGEAIKEPAKTRQKYRYLLAISRPPLTHASGVNLRAYLKSTGVAGSKTSPDGFKTANPAETVNYRKRTTLPPKGYEKQNDTVSDAASIVSHGTSRYEDDNVETGSDGQSGSSRLDQSGTGVREIEDMETKPNGQPGSSRPDQLEANARQIEAAAGTHTDPDDLWVFHPGGESPVLQRVRLIGILGEAKGPRADSLAQILSYLKVGNIIDGTIFAIAMHGPSFRMFQYTGFDQVSTWVYTKNIHTLRTKGAYYAKDGILEIPYEKAVKAFAGSVAPEMLTRKHEVAIANWSKTKIKDLLNYDEPVMDFAASAEELHIERVRITGVTIETIAPVPVYVKSKREADKAGKQEANEQKAGPKSSKKALSESNKLDVQKAVRKTSRRAPSESQVPSGGTGSKRQRTDRSHNPLINYASVQQQRPPLLDTRTLRTPSLVADVSTSRSPSRKAEVEGNDIELARDFKAAALQEAWVSKLRGESPPPEEKVSSWDIQPGHDGIPSLDALEDSTLDVDDGIPFGED